MDRGFLFGNLGANRAVQTINANWVGLWTASVQAVHPGGRYDLVLTRFNTLMTGVIDARYAERKALFDFLATCVQYPGGPALASFKELAVDYAVGDSVLVVFRDQRRDWPMIISRNN